MNEEKQINLAFRSSDLALVAFLVLRFAVVEIDRSTPKRAVFVFQKSEELEQQVNLFWAGQIKIEPRAYFESIKGIKTRIYSEQN